MKSLANHSLRATYDVLFLSPHLDDAAMSCGGHIRRLTQDEYSVLIVSVMAGKPPAGELSPFARSLHERWRLAVEDLSARQMEDIRACEILGADWMHLPIPDCIYRQDPADGGYLYDSEESLFGSLDPHELDLIEEVSKQMSHLPTSASVFAPLAAGNHVDHQLTRLAAESCYGKYALSYFEEFPYAKDPESVRAALTETDLWRFEIIALNQTHIRSRISAIACYASQLSTFFNDHDDLEHQVHTADDKYGGERVWHRISPVQAS